MDHRIPLSLSLLSLLCAGNALAQDKYAVVVGVEAYDTSTFRNLEYASDDADELGESLSLLGFQTTTMTSESSSSKLRPTTPRKITDVISSVTRSCDVNDTLVLSLSGHGVQFSDEPLLPSGVRETYFCPSDADLADKSTLVSITSVVDLMNSCSAGRKLLLVDSCQEHRLSENGQRKSARRIELGSFHENRRSVPSGMAVLFSCSSGQFSWQHAPLGHSVFTFQVLEYLRGNADARYYDSGEAELNGLVSFVSKKTNDYVIGKNLTPDGQFPILRGSSANWKLGKVGQKKKALGGDMLSIKFIDVPGGTIVQDYIKEGQTEPAKIPVGPISVSETEVTVGQFKAFVDATGYRSKASSCEGYDKTKGVFVHSHAFDWQQLGFEQTDSHPVLNLCVIDIDAFCDWLGEQTKAKYRLPTWDEYHWLVFGNMPLDDSSIPEESRWRYKEVKRWHDVWVAHFNPPLLQSSETFEKSRGNVEELASASWFSHDTYQSTEVATTDISKDGLVGLRSNFPERTSDGIGTTIFEPLGFSQSLAERTQGCLAGIRLVKVQ